ncbi:LCP family protein [Nonomuraea sp. NPDC049152]|uniref:LCP family glycopolymer transferase n=1 Tax=Nonomuraea sp. NPDC049152 TaxID=3154350 RepID=UPI0033EE641A
MTGKGREFGPGTAVVLTIGSAMLWGLAHLATGRLRTGFGLMTVYLVLVGLIVTMATAFRGALLSLAVQPTWLVVLTVAIATIALAWSTVIIWSFWLVRPSGAGHNLNLAVAGGLCILVIAPSAWAARVAYVSHDVVTSVFSSISTTPVIAQDPWKGASRVNILLAGADAAANRVGVRTDSMTVASIDTATGSTTLFGLPRNLQQVMLPSGPARDRFPYGFTGEPPATPGLLNEVYQYAEDYPEMVPGVKAGQRGATLLKETISDILGIPVNYYAMVDMAGFAEIIDAMGGVRITIKEPITYGKYNEGLLPAGTRKLSGEDALWFGRSRTNSDDYVRMSRQKCLLNAVAQQADPVTLLNSFENLATATKRAISTDIPADLLPALVDLGQKVKGTHIKSLQFVPPLINTAYPDWHLIKKKVSEALDSSQSFTRRTASRPSTTPSPTPSDNAISLDEVC